MISNDEKKKFCIGARQLRRSSLSSLSLLWSYGRLSLPSFYVSGNCSYFWFFEWITGADLDSHNVDEMNKKRKEEGLPPAPYQDEKMDDHDDVSDTLWDIYTADQLSHHHHDDYDDDYDDRY